MNIQSRHRVLLTRPQAQSEAFARQIHSVLPDVDIIISPVLDIEFLDAVCDAGLYNGLIFTSGNGILAFDRLGLATGQTAYCVGGQTAKAAKAVGLAAVSADGTVDDLYHYIISHTPRTPLLHIRGHHSTGDLAERLTEAGFKTDEAVLYDQVELPLNQMALSSLDNDRPVIVPVFSPRTASILKRYLDVTNAPIAFVAISNAVKLALGTLWTKSSCVADRPNALSMLEQIKGIVGPDQSA